MIRSFADETTRAVFEGRHPKGFPAEILKSARRKLGYLDAATSLDALRIPPGNRLHALTADRAGQYAVRINDQYRLCFRWGEAGPEEVEIADYHSSMLLFQGTGSMLESDVFGKPNSISRIML